MPFASRDKTLPPLPPGEFEFNSLGLDSGDGYSTPQKQRSKSSLRPRIQVKTSIPSPSHYAPLQQSSPVYTEHLDPPPSRGYTSDTNLSPSPSPSKGSLRSVTSTSSYDLRQRSQITANKYFLPPYSQPTGQAHETTSTTTNHSMSTGTSSPPASPSTIRTMTSVDSAQTPTKRIFAPTAPSPLSLSMARDYARHGSEPTVMTGVGKKRSSSQLLAGLGKGLGRMGSVVRQTASDGHAQLVNPHGQVGGRSVSASATSGGSGRSKRGWKPKAKERHISLQEEEEDQPAAQAQAQLPSPSSRNESGMDIGDEGIGLPFNVEHDLHVSPSLEDLPPAWLESLKQQAARKRQAAASKSSTPIANRQEGPELVPKPSHSGADAERSGGSQEQLKVESAHSPTRFGETSFLASPEFTSEPLSFTLSLDEPSSSVGETSGTSRGSDEAGDQPTQLHETAITGTSKRDKRLSDQLRHFSQLRIGEDDESWAASLLGVFSEPEVKLRPMGPIDDKAGHRLPSKIGQGSSGLSSVVELLTQSRVPSELIRVEAEASPSPVKSSIDVRTSQTGTREDTRFAPSTAPLLPASESTSFAYTGLYDSLRRPPSFVSLLDSHSGPLSTSQNRFRLPSPSRPLGARPLLATTWGPTLTRSSSSVKTPVDAPHSPNSPTPTSARLTKMNDEPLLSGAQTPPPDMASVEFGVYYRLHAKSWSSLDGALITPSSSVAQRHLHRQQLREGDSPSTQRDEGHSVASHASHGEEDEYHAEEEPYDHTSDLDLVEAMVSDRYPESLASDRVKNVPLLDSPMISPSLRGHPLVSRNPSPLSMSDSMESGPMIFKPHGTPDADRPDVDIDGRNITQQRPVMGLGLELLQEDPRSGARASNSVPVSAAASLLSRANSPASDPIPVSPISRDRCRSSNSAGTIQLRERHPDTYMQQEAPCNRPANRGSGHFQNAEPETDDLDAISASLDHSHDDLVSPLISEDYRRAQPRDSRTWTFSYSSSDGFSESGY